MKKVLSVFLSVIMLLSITAGIDLTAYAEVNTYSGSCGIGVHYNLNITTGNLNISGTGRMQDYISESVPWFSNSSKIKNYN